MKQRFSVPSTASDRSQDARESRDGRFSLGDITNSESASSQFHTESRFRPVKDSMRVWFFPLLLGIVLDRGPLATAVEAKSGCR